MPAIIAIGLGGALVMPAINVAAMHDIDESETGIASGLLNAGQQVGGAVGLAVLVAIAVDRAAGGRASGVSAAASQVHGDRLAFAVGTVLIVIGALVAAALVGGIKASGGQGIALPVDLDDDEVQRSSVGSAGLVLGD